MNCAVLPFEVVQLYVPSLQFKLDHYPSLPWTVPTHFIIQNIAAKLHIKKPVLFSLRPITEIPTSA